MCVCKNGELMVNDLDLKMPEVEWILDIVSESGFGVAIVNMKVPDENAT